MCFLLLAVFTQTAHAKRVALVVGNSSYSERPLRNPVNDANLMQSTLKDLGFEVTLLRNADRRSLLAGLREFEGKARDAEVALFFFAGHGAQVGGNNYLIPVGGSIQGETDVPDEAVDAASVLRRLEDARSKVALVILDACRDNPFAGASRSSSRGLGRMSVPTGTIVAYATAPGSTAADGTGSNGVYTEQLVRQFKTPNLDIKDIFDRTAQEVERITSGKQRPREEIGLRGRFVLNGAQVANIRAEPTDLNTAQMEQMVWMAAQRTNTVNGYNAYLAEYPKGNYMSAARVARAALEPVPSQSAQAVSALPNQPTTLTSGQIIKDCSNCPELVVIPAGSFTMGSSAQEQALAIAAGADEEQTARESPQHTVNIKSFAAGRFAVTKGEFAAFVKAKAYQTTAEKGAGCGVSKDGKLQNDKDANWLSVGFTQGDDHPVVCVSWDDAQAYVQWLSQVSGKPYRLLNDSEREYATRAGSQSAFWWGDTIDRSQANYSGTAKSYNGSPKGAPRKSTVPVNSFSANPFGLYNVHGNVDEWVQDCPHNNYIDAPTDGSAWVDNCSGVTHILRGGNWAFPPRHLRSASNMRLPSDRAIFTNGFRVARTFTP